MNYENKKDCHLMVWETIQSKRNINNQIKFNLLDKFTASVGDVIKCNIGNGKFSCYKLLEIEDVRPSSISKMNYIVAITEWFIS
jgi:hypothetical protein